MNQPLGQQSKGAFSKPRFDQLVQGKDGYWAVCFRNLLNQDEREIRLVFTQFGDVGPIRSSGVWTFVRFHTEAEARAALDDPGIQSSLGDFVKPARCTITEKFQKKDEVAESSNKNTEESSSKPSFNNKNSSEQPEGLKNIQQARSVCGDSSVPSNGFKPHIKTDLSTPPPTAFAPENIDQLPVTGKHNSPPRIEARVNNGPVSNQSKGLGRGHVPPKHRATGPVQREVPGNTWRPAGCPQQNSPAQQFHPRQNYAQERRHAGYNQHAMPEPQYTLNGEGENGPNYGNVHSHSRPVVDHIQQTFGRPSLNQQQLTSKNRNQHAMPEPQYTLNCEGENGPYYGNVHSHSRPVGDHAQQTFGRPSLNQQQSPIKNRNQHAMPEPQYTLNCEGENRLNYGNVHSHSIRVGDNLQQTFGRLDLNQQQLPSKNSNWEDLSQVTRTFNNPPPQIQRSRQERTNEIAAKMEKRAALKHERKKFMDAKVKSTASNQNKGPMGQADPTSDDCTVDEIHSDIIISNFPDVLSEEDLWVLFGKQDVLDITVHSVQGRRYCHVLVSSAQKEEDLLALDNFEVFEQKLLALKVEDLVCIGLVKLSNDRKL